MIETILSLIGGIKGAILGGLGLIGGLWALLLKRKNDRLQRENIEQRLAIKTHEAKERVHSNDETVDKSVESRVDELRDKVADAATPDQAAQEVSNVFNDYFRGGKQ